MKTTALLSRTAAFALFIATTTTLAARADAPSVPSAPSPTAALETNGVPQSVFTVPASPTQGRDPFYPNAHYLGGGGEVKHAPVSTEADTLELKAVSGSADP